MNLFFNGLVTFATAIGINSFFINDYHGARQWPSGKATLDSSNRQDDVLKAEFWIRIQGFDDQKLRKKNTAENLFDLVFIKNCNFLIPRPSALKREHPVLQKMKFINFLFYICGSAGSAIWIHEGKKTH